MNAVQLKEGLAYADFNFTCINSFVRLDKELISKNFNVRGKNVLDFGCGMGHMSVWLAKELGAIVDGVDIDENHIMVAREYQKKQNASNLTFSIRNIITDPIDKKYDFIFLNDVIEHIHIDWIQDVLDVLIYKNLANGGVIFFSYPPWDGPHASHLQPATKIPWVQFLPRNFVVSLVKNRNQQLVGKHDLLTEFMELNHMSHPKLMRYLKKYSLQKIFRKSHTKLNRISFLKNANLNFFPFNYIVTKELVAFRKIG